ncbi:MAG: hypothetical protein IPL39_15185 [Opitutaceae bacterium]|nr:hypothetical protein [Opitutaceae bacterium]
MQTHRTTVAAPAKPLYPAHHEYRTDRARTILMTGFEKSRLSPPIDLLRRAGVRVVIASLSPN